MKSRRFLFRLVTPVMALVCALAALPVEAVPGDPADKKAPLVIPPNAVTVTLEGDVMQVNLEKSILVVREVLVAWNESTLFIDAEGLPVASHELLPGMPVRIEGVETALGCLATSVSLNGPVKKGKSGAAGPA